MIFNSNKQIVISFILLISSAFFFLNPVLAETVELANINEKAPQFILDGYSNKIKSKIEWSLKENRGQWLVLYFYPKDFTSGCTIEAKGFQRLNKKFTMLNTNVIGISTDNADSHKDFCKNKNLEFTLLTDVDGNISKKYNSWNLTTPKRNTFLIDPAGIIRYRWTSVNPTSHPNEVIEKLKRLQS
tara:strand:+ start:530 stop:1087 length:558 start_codon:yes stop_codon:yes gene_type:complete